MGSVSDNFNRADATLTTPWANAGGSDFEVTSNQCNLSTGSWAAAKYETAVGNNDNEFEIDVENISSGGWVGVGARFNGTDNDGYIAIISSAGATRFYKWDGGLNGQIGSNVNITLPSYPFTLKIRVEGSDLKLFVNGTERNSTTDSSITTGEFGAIIAQNSASILDNFAGSDLAAESIDLNVVEYTTFQRDIDNNIGTISCNATWTGTPSGIEARWNGGSYTTVDVAPTGGTSLVSLTGQTPGEGTLDVRFTNNTGVIESVDNILLGDVFLIAGQSNAEGRANGAQSYSGDYTATMYNSAGWSELADPTAPDTVSVGSVWPLVAIDLLAQQQVPMAFIQTAVGGTQLYNSVWESGGDRYNDSVGSFDDSNTNAVAAILWHQGEADASSSVSKANYKNSLSEMVDGYENDITFIDGAKLICAQIGQRTSTSDDNVNNIRLAQSESWDEDSRIYEGPVLWSEVQLDDGVHFASLKEATELRHNWVTSISGVLYGGTNTAPKVSSIGSSGSFVDIVFDKAITNPGGNYNAGIFGAFDDTGDIPVGTGVYLNSTTVRLTLASEPSGDTYISMGSGNLTGAGEDPVIPRSNDDYFNKTARPFIYEPIQSVISGPTIIQKLILFSNGTYTTEVI